MARIRAIKPDFFLDESLAELPAMTRLLFIGLWTLADKDGLLEDRPKRIKASLLPYDATDVEPLLAALNAAGFVTRYEVDGVACIAIRNFAKHQRPHPKETSYGLPPCPSTASREKKRQGADASRRVPVVVGDGRLLMVDGNGDGVSASQVAPPEASPRTATETLALGLQSLAAAEEPAETAVPKEPRPEDLQSLWNAEAHPTLPRWQGMSDKRKRAAAARLRERPLQVWSEVIRRLSASPFCRGEEGGGWRASPDWILQPDVADKVLEGKYDRPAAVNGDRPRLGPPAAPPRVSGDRPRI